MIWKFLIVFEIISIISATYMTIFGDWEDVIKRDIFTDYIDYIMYSYIIAIIFGWCTFPVFIIAVIKDIMNDINVED